MDNRLYFESGNSDDVLLFSEELRRLVDEYKPDKKIVFVCIGTDRATGDSLGPLVGHYLKNSGFVRVYGTLEEPVHAKNLNDTINRISDKIDNPLIIAIDASLGRESSIGSYVLHSGPIKPGSGVGKDFPCIGDISITGIVNQSGLFDEMLLQTTRLGLVMKLVESITKGIDDCMQQLSS